MTPERKRYLMRCSNETKSLIAGIKEYRQGIKRFKKMFMKGDKLQLFNRLIRYNIAQQKMCIKALKKQLAAPVICYYDKRICPLCGFHYDRSDFSLYCKHCGQRLKWK